jgi:hypothetical protein
MTPPHSATASGGPSLDEGAPAVPIFVRTPTVNFFEIVCRPSSSQIVTQLDQFIRAIGNNSLGPAIEPRRHALHKRRDLRNFHVYSLQRDRLAVT